MYSRDRGLYLDVSSALDRALASERGIRLHYPTRPEANRFRGRVHAFRKLDREESKSIHPEDSPAYGVSTYDDLTLRIEGTDVLVTKVTKPFIEDL